MIGKVTYSTTGNRPTPIGNTPGAETLARWLGNDIQYSINSLARWRNLMEHVASGLQNSGYLGTGNSHSVSATRDFVYIESEFVESHKVYLTIDQAMHVLGDYERFLRSEDPAPPPFEVEYIAETDNALTLFLENGGSIV